MSKKISGLDYIAKLLKWKIRIFINFFIIGILSIGLSLSVPLWFRTSATILPPVDDIGAGFDISSLMSQIPVGGAFGLGGASDATTTLLAVFNSRTIMEKVAVQFDMQKQLEKDTMEETIKALRKRLKTELNDDGTITFSAMSKTKFFPYRGTQIQEAKKQSFEMLSFIMGQVDSLNIKLKIEKARNSRLFIEKRYHQNLNDIAAAEDSFKVFQEKYGAIALPEQTVATIEAAAKLQAEATIKELDLGIKKTYMDKSHPLVKNLEKEIDAINKSLLGLKNGKNSKDNLFVPLGDVPELGIQYARLFRELELQTEIMKFLLPQYEQAKIQEQRDTPTIQYLDRPKMPERKAKPKRALIVLFALFLCGFSYIIAAYLDVNMHSMRENDPENFAKINGILNDIKIRNWLK